MKLYIYALAIILFSCNKNNEISLTTQNNLKNLSIIDANIINDNIYVFYSTDNDNKAIYNVSKVSEKLSIIKTIKIDTPQSLILILNNGEYELVNQKYLNQDSSIFLNNKFNQILIYDNALNLIEKRNVNEYEKLINENIINHYHKTLNKGRFNKTSEFYIKKTDSISNFNLTYSSFKTFEFNKGFYIIHSMIEKGNIKLGVNNYNNRKEYSNQLLANLVKNNRGFANPKALQMNEKIFLFSTEISNPKFHFLCIDLSTGKLIEENYIDNENIQDCQSVKNISKDVNVYSTANKNILFSYAINAKDEICLCEHKTQNDLSALIVLKNRKKLYYIGINQGKKNEIIIRQE